MEDPLILTGDGSTQDMLLCPLCHEHFTNPRVLPCQGQHTFCSGCLSKYFNDRQASSRTTLKAIPCPTCRTIVGLPVLGVTAFPASQKMAGVCNLLKYMDKVNKARKPAKRDEESAATTRESPPEPQTENKNVHSTLHGTSVGERDYAKPVNDPENTASESDGNSEETESDDNLVFETFHSYVECGVTDSSTEDVRQYETVEQEKNLKNELNASASEEVEDRAEPLLESTHYSSQQRAYVSPPSAQQDDIGVTSQVRCDQNMCNEDSAAEVGARSTTETKSLQAESAVAGVEESGDVDEESKDADQEKRDMGKETLGHIYSTPQLYWQLERRDYEMPTAAVLLPNGRIVVADYGKGCIEIYEGDGTFIRSIEDVKPFSICVNSEGRFVIGDRLDKTLKIYDTDGEMYDEWSKGKFDWVCGIGQNKASNLVVYDRQHCKVGFYDDFENCLSSFGRYGDRRDNELCMADFIAVDDQDHIVICDSGSHSVKVFNDRGQFQYSFGGRGSQDGELLWPKGIAMDSKGNIIVTDQRNDRVSMFTPDGVFVQHLVEDWPRPYNVSCSDDTLLVCSYTLNGHSNVAVYKLNQL